MLQISILVIRPFIVAYDGKVIAELRRNEEWEQICGEPLEEDAFVSIKQAIETNSINHRGGKLRARNRKRQG